MTDAVERRAGPDDLEALVALHQAFCEIDQHPFDAVGARRALLALLTSDDHGVVWVVDEPAGYAVVTWGWSIEAGGAECVLDEIFVSSRGAGVGSRLLRAVIADCRRRGVGRMVLETEAQNAAARALYARHGFRSDDSIWMSLDLTDAGQR